jgi:two-component system, NarL family, sensor histidine kinase DesK
MRLLPDNRQHGWAPYTWLVYFGFFFLDPIVNHVGWKAWLANGLGTIAFLVLYFGFFWLKPPRNFLNLAAILLLGIGFAPFNEGACTFFVYAASFLPFAVESEGTVIALLGGLFAVATLEWWLLHLSGWFLLYAGGLSIAVGLGNIFFAQRNRSNERLRKANDEIEHLAKVAERERIARDLHDVLGHTLSLIILKSELAGKLIERDPERAKAEIRDVEQTSREALAEVRSTIRGYRVHRLDTELKQAKVTLETAGVAVRSETAEISLTPAQESVVALVVREAVTNVVRHAQAQNCRLQLTPVNGNCQLEIQDDGCGGLQPEGNGLRGMRERVEALGGTIERNTSKGTKLTIRFPLPTQGNCAT